VFTKKNSQRKISIVEGHVKRKNSLEMKMYCKEVNTNLRRPKSSLLMNVITSFYCFAIFPDFYQFLAQKFCLASKNLGRKVRRCPIDQKFSFKWSLAFSGGKQGNNKTNFVQKPKFL
jgi:hypothetical protein